MKDGSKGPDFKSFESEEFDIDTKTFKGTTTWGEDKPEYLEFKGSVLVYTLKFSQDLCKIESETIESFDEKGTKVEKVEKKN